MVNKVLLVITNDSEFSTSGDWGKNPVDGSTDLVFPDSIQAQLVTRNLGLARALAEFGLVQNVMVSWGCFRSLELAAGLARQNRLPAGVWSALYQSALDLLWELKERGDGLYPHPHYEKDLSCEDPDYRYSAEHNALERWSKTPDGLYQFRGSFSRAANLARLGSYVEPESRLGYLYAGRKWLADHLQTGGIGARTGGWDFGYTDEEKALSEEAYLQNGIFVNLDADRNVTAWRGLPPPPKPWAESSYLTQPGDINQRAQDPANWDMVEFAHCTGLDSWYRRYDLNEESEEQLNREIDTAVAALGEDGGEEGVQVVVAMCHSAMLIGEPWDAPEGGYFAKLQAHFRYLTERYVEPGLVRCVTLEQATAEFLDSHSRRVVGWAGPATPTESGWEVPLTLAGGAELDAPQQVEVFLPLHLDPEPGGAGVAAHCGERALPVEWVGGLSPRVRLTVGRAERERGVRLVVPRPGRP